LEAKFASPTDFPKSFSAKSHDFDELNELIEAIDYLPVSRLRIEPFQGLLEGFKQDLQFNHHKRVFPIFSESELEDYAYHVAGTVGLCVLDLIFHHFPQQQSSTAPSLNEEVRQAGCQMGKALQYINIARDIGRDAAIDRVYLPTTWLKEAGVSPEDVVFCPSDPRVDGVRSRVLRKAKQLHDQSENAIRNLPLEVQGPLYATVKSYMEIGAALERGARPCHPDHKLRLSIPRRLVVVYKAMVVASRK
jgi:15-cis-phytoene synthase/lycopene beta-cyclase